MSPAEAVLDDVERCVHLYEVAPGCWQGPNVVLGGYGRLFGGQLLAQAIAAAAAHHPRIEGKVVRSVHLVFTAEGRPGSPVSWFVDALHEGRTFATRSVVAKQGERLLAAGVVSLHVPDSVEGSLDHSLSPPDTESPTSLQAAPELGAMALEMRVPGGGAIDGLDVGPPELLVWMKAPRALPGDELLHQEVLAYASDLTMMVAAMRPHAGVGFGSPRVVASAVTSHTVSFHRHLDVGEWLLFAQQSPAAAAGRVYTRGDWFDRSGNVVASCSQEALIRVSPP